MKVKGNILKARIAFVRERFGDAGWAKVIAALPARDQEQLKSTMNVGWYDFDLSDRLDKAIVGALGGGREPDDRPRGVPSAAGSAEVHGQGAADLRVLLRHGPPHLGADRAHL